MWQCPLCKLSLQTHQTESPYAPLSTWSCTNKHSFDRAKQGYVNLLPVQNKRSKMPGDDAQMVLARTTFFSHKPYQTLVEKLASLLIDNVPRNSECDAGTRNLDWGGCGSINIYDSGCGEGYYLSAISTLIRAASWGKNSPEFVFSGHDISKPAVIAASKRNKDKQLVVASTVNMPVVSASQDFILQVFAPSCASEYARVIKPSGLVITVDPAPKHLIELKALVYDTPELHSENINSLAGFNLSAQHDVNFTVSLNDADVRLALLQMTPFYWKTNEQQKERIANSLQQVSADFVIRVWQKADKIAPESLLNGRDEQ